MNALSRAQTFYSILWGLPSPPNFFPSFRMVTFTLTLLMLNMTKAILKGIKYPIVRTQAITAHKRVQQGSRESYL